MATEKLEGLIARLEKVTGKLESVSARGGSGAGAAVEDDPAWYDEYKTIHDGQWENFLKATKESGDADLVTLEQKLRAAFNAHKDLMTIAARNGKPAQKDLNELVKPLSTAIGDLQSFRENARSSKKFNHLTAVSEAIPFLGWVVAPSKPGNYVKEMKDSAEFYTNKVLKEFKETDPKHVQWAKDLKALMVDFSEYLKNNHPAVLQWNPDKPAATASAKASSGGGAAPPPPPPPAVAPPPPPPVAPASSSNNSGAEDSRAALFSQLNKGSDVTSGLKKVTDDMKTHKNPSLRDAKPVPPKKSSSLSPRPYTPPQYKKFNAPVAEKPPVFELQMKKWIVEHQKNNQSLVIEDTNDKQTVYMYKCNNSVLQVKGKVNSITLDGCTKCGVVFEDLISTCEFVNCQSIKAQANGKVPTISIDKTDGTQIYLNEKSLDTQIITAKSSEMNICITKPDGDLNEFPVPEQYKTVWNGTKFVTTVMDLNL